MEHILVIFYIFIGLSTYGNAQTCPVSPAVPTVFMDQACFLPTPVDLGALKSSVDVLTKFGPMAHAYARYLMSYWQGRPLTSFTGADTLCVKNDKYNNSGIIQFTTSANTAGTGTITTYKKLVSLPVQTIASVYDLACPNPAANVYAVATFPPDLWNILAAAFNPLGLNIPQLVEWLVGGNLLQLSILYVGCDPNTGEAFWYLKSTGKIVNQITQTAVNNAVELLGFNSTLTIISDYSVCDNSI